uniref:Uncharacterized protein n=1 Tax=Anguilla anguilla TaxID=7936 RepID=A0A0E9T2K0_ANGAN
MRRLHNMFQANISAYVRIQKYRRNMLNTIHFTNQKFC